VSRQVDGRAGRSASVPRFGDRLPGHRRTAKAQRGLEPGPPEAMDVVVTADEFLAAAGPGGNAR